MLRLVTQSFGIIAATFALLGTAIQAFASLKQLKEVDPDGHRAFIAVDDLSTEFHAVLHPVRGLRRHKEVRQLLRESPEEARLYRRVKFQIWAWVLLSVASAFALLTAALGA